MGRPRINISEYYEKIRPYLRRGLSLYDSCSQAKVPYQTVWGYTQESKEFSEKIKTDREWPSVVARTVLVDKIEEGDAEISKWWLERKKKGEFSTRTENINANVDVNQIITNLSDDKREELTAVEVEALEAGAFVQDKEQGGGSGDVQTEQSSKNLPSEPKEPQVQQDNKG